MHRFFNHMIFIIYFKSWCLLSHVSFLHIIICCMLLIWLMGQCWPVSVIKTTTTTLCRSLYIHIYILSTIYQLANHKRGFAPRDHPIYPIFHLPKAVLYGWPKWTKSGKGSTYEKFHVRKHTRIKSSVKESIRVSQCTNQNSIFNTCNFSYV